MAGAAVDGRLVGQRVGRRSIVAASTPPRPAAAGGVAVGVVMAVVVMTVVVVTARTGFIKEGDRGRGQR